MAATTPLEVPAARRGGERPVYTGAAVIAILVMLAGFAPTFYLAGPFGGPGLTALKVAHGVVMTTWFALFLVQARLVATGNTAVHRRLGLIGVAVAVLVVALGMQLAIASAHAGATPLASIPPLVFLVMPLGELFTFTLLVAAAIALRRKSAWHKRFMLVASLAMLAPAMARLPFDFVRSVGPPAFFALTDIVIIGCVAYDAVKNRRVHPAWLVGLAVVFASQLGRLLVARTPEWMAFAKWLTS